MGIRMKFDFPFKEDLPLPIITVSRQMCSLGEEVAEALSRELGWELISRSKLFSFFPVGTASGYDLHMLAESAKYYLKDARTGEPFRDILIRALRDFSESTPAVMMGFGSQVIFSERRDALHIRIVAPREIRILRAKKQYHVSDEEAEKILDTADKKHKKFVSTVFGADLTEPSHYHLTLNTAFLTVDECAAAVIALLEEHEERIRQEQQTESAEITELPADRPAFKNDSEAEFAQILNMYHIDWEYEPKTFPIEWDAEGNVTMAFSPDFLSDKVRYIYRADHDEQKYVTIKNRKQKKVRELYPGTNIKIVYKKDFYSLVDRYNLNKGE